MIDIFLSMITSVYAIIQLGHSKKQKTFSKGKGSMIET